MIERRSCLSLQSVRRISHRGLFAACCLLTAAAANAQMAGLFQRLDTNQDGKISRAEFPGGDVLFSKCDTNNDGFIDAKEAQAAESLWRMMRSKGGSDASAGGRTGRASPALPDNIELQNDIVYKTVAGKALTLDLYRVKGKAYSHAPLVVFIHGGGYIGGDKQGAVNRHPDILGTLLREHGYLAASLNYRLCTPQGPKLIDCSTDCKDAVRFLVKNAAKYGIDPHRIASMGTSAGGSLALLLPLSKDDELPGDVALAHQPAHVTCAVSWFGCTDFSQLDLIKEFASQKVAQRTPVLFASAPGAILRECESVSPVCYMKRAAVKPPLLLVHGDSDQTVPIRQSTWMYEEARKLDAPVTLVTVKKAGHGFKEAPGPIAPSRDEINKLTREFILKHNQ